MIDTTQGNDLYAADFARFGETAAGRLHRPIREAAYARFTALGFPTTRHEDWRFTNVAALAKTAFTLAGPDGTTVRTADFVDVAPAVTDWPRLVFVNGWYVAGLSTAGRVPEGVRAGSLAEALSFDAGAIGEHLFRHARYEEHAFTALNTAFAADGAFLHVPDGMDLPHPIDVVHVATPGAEPRMAHPRNLFVVGAGSRVTIIERYVGASDGVYFTNAVTEMIAGANAKIDHVKVGRESDRAYHVGAAHFHQDRDSTITSHTVTLGGAIVRNEITPVLDGPGAECGLNGLYLASGRQHVDNHLRVEHAQPHCDSREFFKGILEDRARAVFTGRIVVHKDAQKTDAKQTNMNLLLSEDAQVDTKPQLEIFADDVKCTHGATIGQIDEDAIFYMQTRGIDRETARGVLIFGFAEESLDHIAVVPLRKQLQEVLFDRLPQGHLLRGAV
jgi:Fe-S cluster assembly protein SufD